MKTTLRIGAVLFALTMLTTYVVYSQLQQARQISPGSKGGIIRNGQELSTTATTNQHATPRLVVAPGSKSRAPLIPVQASSAPRNPGPQRSELLGSSSKSAPVFDPRRAQAPGLPVIQRQQELTNKLDVIKK